MNTVASGLTLCLLSFKMCLLSDSPPFFFFPVHWGNLICQDLTFVLESEDNSLVWGPRCRLTLCWLVESFRIGEVSLSAPNFSAEKKQKFLPFSCSKTTVDQKMGLSRCFTTDFAPQGSRRFHHPTVVIFKPVFHNCHGREEWAKFTHTSNKCFLHSDTYYRLSHFTDQKSQLPCLNFKVQSFPVASAKYQWIMDISVITRK